MMTAFKTVLAQGAPWLHTSVPVTEHTNVINLAKPVSARLGMQYRTREKRPVKPEIQERLRQYLRENPGHNITYIHKALGWSLSKTERVMTEIRAEIGNGHFLKSSLKDISK
jgi:hypothetical protein